MALFVIGINHNTALVDLREKVAFTPEKLKLALNELHLHHVIDGAVIVSTCNRSEIYCEIGPQFESVLIDWLASFHQLSVELLKPSLYVYQDRFAILHLMKVSCGLDSLILGEPQILGQIKQAFLDAKNEQSVSATLDKLFQKTFSVAKRVRTQTQIGENAVSVAYAATLLAKQIFESLQVAKILLVGAGETIELVATHLHSTGVANITVANRSKSRADKLAQKFNAHTISLAQIPEFLPQADIVISSTASQLPIIGKGMVEAALKKRRNKPMLFIDIAVPRDIESQVDEIDDVYLYTVDDLQLIIAHNMQQRQDAALQAEAIINEECELFMQWLRSLEAVDSIRQYRQASNNIKDMVLTKALQDIAMGSDPKIVLTELSNQLTNKLIHNPTIALQKAAKHGEFEKLTTIRQTIGLDEF